MSNLQSRWLLAIVLMLAAAAGFMLGLPGGAPVLATMLRAVLGVCLVLVGPGLAVTAALLPLQQLGSAEHVLAVFVTSIALAVIGGIVLNATPWGLQPLSWAAMLGAVTVGAALVALVRLRGRRKRAGNPSGSTQGAEYQATAPQVPTARLALPIVALVLLGMAVYVARMPAPADRFQGYTTLWMAPNAEQAAPGARIGVQSAEFAPTSYRLEVRVNGQVAGVWPDLTLAPNQAWQTQVALPDAGGNGTEFEALLYRNDAPQIVYRQVRFGHLGAGETARPSRAG